MGMKYKKERQLKNHRDQRERDDKGMETVMLFDRGEFIVGSW